MTYKIDYSSYKNSQYKSLIRETTKCSEEEAWEIEDIMRNGIFMSTLDWQTKKQLQKAAKTAYQVVKRRQSCLIM